MTDILICVVNINVGKTLALFSESIKQPQYGKKENLPASASSGETIDCFVIIKFAKGRSHKNWQ